MGVHVKSFIRASEISACQAYFMTSLYLTSFPANTPTLYVCLSPFVVGVMICMRKHNRPSSEAASCLRPACDTQAASGPEGWGATGCHSCTQQPFSFSRTSAVRGDDLSSFITGCRLKSKWKVNCWTSNTWRAVLWMRLIRLHLNTMPPSRNILTLTCSCTQELNTSRNKLSWLQEKELCCNVSINPMESEQPD